MREPAANFLKTFFIFACLGLAMHWSKISKAWGQRALRLTGNQGKQLPSSGKARYCCSPARACQCLVPAASPMVQPTCTLHQQRLPDALPCLSCNRPAGPPESTRVVDWSWRRNACVPNAVLAPVAPSMQNNSD
jgi:hypothetical protein